jgi:hypothetical protein
LIPWAGVRRTRPNVLNVSYVKNQNVTVGSSLGQPLDVLQPRLLRLAMQMKF